MNTCVRKPYVPIRADILYEAMLALRMKAQHEADISQDGLTREETAEWRHAEAIATELLRATNKVETRSGTTVTRSTIPIDQGLPTQLQLAAIIAMRDGVGTPPPFQEGDAEAHLFVCKKPGRTMVFCSMHPQGLDRFPWTGPGSDQWSTVTRWALVKAGEPKEMLPPKTNTGV